MQNISGYFKDWKFGHYTAIHSDGRSIWICNGFTGFGDSNDSQAFLMGFSYFEKKAFWKELKKEIKRRSLKNFNK